MGSWDGSECDKLMKYSLTSASIDTGRSMTQLNVLHCVPFLHYISVYTFGDPTDIIHASSGPYRTTT